MRPTNSSSGPFIRARSSRRSPPSSRVHLSDGFARVQPKSLLLYGTEYGSVQGTFMARALARLKAVTIARAKQPGLLADGGGLYLRIGPSGAKSWVFRYRRRDGERKGKLRDMGLGASHSLSLVEAREEAERCRKLLLRGTDPIEARRSEEATARVVAASAIPFRHCAESYIASHRAGWRNAKHAEQWEDTLERYVYPVFGDLPAQAVDTGLVLKVIAPVWAEKTDRAKTRRAGAAIWTSYCRSCRRQNGRSARQPAGVSTTRQCLTRTFPHSWQSYAGAPRFQREHLSSRS